MPNDRAILELLRVLYSAPTEPKRWDDFLRSLGREVGVTKAAISVHDLSRYGNELVDLRGDYERYCSQPWTGSPYGAEREVGTLLPAVSLRQHRPVAPQMGYFED
jgi:hypothetical protein